MDDYVRTLLLRLTIRPGAINGMHDAQRSQAYIVIFTLLYFHEYCNENNIMQFKTSNILHFGSKSGLFDVISYFHRKNIFKQGHQCAECAKIWPARKIIRF